jgi:hypothetical protein
MLIRLHLIEVFSITLAESIVGIELELGRLDGVDATGAEPNTASPPAPPTATLPTMAPVAFTA